MSATAKRERIGILGGGVAGLSLAYYLERAGYSDVTVLEAQDRAGGQCLGRDVDGRPYDVGAIFADASYSRVFSLTEELGLARGARTGGFLRFERGEFSAPLGGPDILGPIEDKIANLDLETGYTSLSKPGFRDLHPDLYLTFDDFVAKHDLDDLKQLLLPFWTGFGYGFFSSSPTAYVLKYMNREARRACFGTGAVFFLEGGFAGLCDALARRVELRTRWSVNRIERLGGGGFGVESATGEREQFDRLVVCFDPRRLRGLMDCETDLEALLDRVEDYDYNVALMTVDDWSPRSLIMVDNLVPDRRGHVQIAVRRHRDAPVYVLYSLSEGLSDDEVLETFRSDIASQGGSLRATHLSKRWQYFQHVDAAAMQDGFYDRLEGLQARDGLYFGGQLMNHSSVERVVEYSEDLTRRFFA